MLLSYSAHPLSKVVPTACRLCSANINYLHILPICQVPLAHFFSLTLIIDRHRKTLLPLFSFSRAEKPPFVIKVAAMAFFSQIILGLCSFS